MDFVQFKSCSRLRGEKPASDEVGEVAMPSRGGPLACSLLAAPCHSEVNIAAVARRQRTGQSPMQWRG
jgi:hypothetical protein